MQVVSMCKMIVLIILPVPLNKKWTETLDSTLLQNHDNKPSYINSPDRLKASTKRTLNLICLSFPFFLLALKLWLFSIHIYLYYMATTTFWTVLIQLKLKEGKQPLKPGLLRHRKILEAGLHHGRFWGGVKVGRRLPSPANAGHVCVKLTGESAARSPFQEGGPDGWLE